MEQPAIRWFESNPRTKVLGRQVVSQRDIEKCVLYYLGVAQLVERHLAGGGREYESYHPDQTIR